MKPLLQALLLADRVYQDKTGKHIIAGVFNKYVFSTSSPRRKTVVIDGEERQIIPGGAQAGSPYAYVSLTEIRGKVQCVLRYVSLGDDRALFETRLTISCPDPLQTVELVLPLPTLPPVAGVHALELLCDAEPIGSYRVIVEEVKEVGDDNDSSD